MARTDPTFAKFSNIHLSEDGEPDHHDLHLAGLAVHEQSGWHHNDGLGVGLLFAQNWTICVRNSRLREGAAADPYSAPDVRVVALLGRSLSVIAILGLRPATGDIPPPTRQIGADLHDDRLIVTIGADSPGGHTWAISPPPHVREQLRHYRGFAILLTTKALPGRLAPEDLPAAFNDPW
jgi:hypothetical protein